MKFLCNKKLLKRPLDQGHLVKFYAESRRRPEGILLINPNRTGALKANTKIS